MRISILTIGAVASIIAINSVFADTIVTSQSYVDNRDALKQDKITAGTTGNVVTYNGTQNGQAQFSERGIYDGTNLYNWREDADKLVTASALQDVSNNLPTTTTTNRVCTEWVSGQSHTDANCLLWNLTDQVVYGRCYTDGECRCTCGGGCVQNTCVCDDCL